jgi:NADH-quinone oxidoreductase subunit G
MDVLYLLGADEIDTARLAKTFVIYQGSHGDAGAHRADVILPGSAYTEKSGTYVNLEGRAQLAAKAAFAPGQAKDDWAILRALSAHAGQQLTYDTIDALRAAMYRAAPQLARLDSVAPADPAAITKLAAHGGSMSGFPFKNAIRDFYLTNPIARASTVMGELAALTANAAPRVAAE